MATTILVDYFAPYELLKDPKISNNEYEFQVDAGITRRFYKIERLGVGGFGEIWSVKEKETDKEYALKIFNQEKLDKNAAGLIRESHDIAREHLKSCRQIATIYECYHIIIDREF